VTAGLGIITKVWDATTGAELRSLSGHTGFVYSASFSPDGARIVTTSRDKTAKVWDAATGAELRTFRGHTDSVSSASFSPDGTRIVTASGDRTAKVWYAATGVEVLTLRGHTTGVTSAAFSPDGTRIVTAGGDRKVKVWDLNEKRRLEVLTLEEVTRNGIGFVNSASFSPDGARIVTGGLGVSETIWDPRTGAVILTRSGHSGVQSSSFSPDGTRVVTGGFSNTAQVWDATTGAPVIALKGHTGAINSASFSRDGARIITASRDRTVKIWDAATGAVLLTLQGHTQDVNSAAFSADGTRVVSASRDRTARIWNATTGAGLLTFTRHRSDVDSGSFSPDGTRVVTGGADAMAKVWDATTGAELLTLRGHTNAITLASFSPDGSRIVTASRDQTARLWDATTGAELLTLRGHSDGLFSASFSRDGSRIVTASSDGTAKVWDAGPILPAGPAPAGGKPPENLTTPLNQPSQPLAQRSTPASRTSTPVRALPGPPEPPAEAPASPSRQLPASVVALLGDLRNEGKSKLAEDLIHEIHQAQDAVAGFQKNFPDREAHVIVGRVVGKELNDASRVAAQMSVHSEGYFVGPVGASGRPVGFRAQGYLPVEITPQGQDGTVEDVGVVRLEPVPEPLRAAVKGAFVFEGAKVASPVTSRLVIRTGPINSIRGTYPTLTAPPMHLALQDSGAFSASELSPTEYLLHFEARGFVRQTRPFALKPGETLDLGTIVLERPRRISLSYRVAVSPPFSQAPPLEQTVLPGEFFKANRARGSGIDLMFDQQNGEIRFGFASPSTSIGDLGPGALDDFLQVDPGSVRFTSPRNASPQSGHVYLLEHKDLKHWVLFRLQLDP
jgi:WD40 repeat protein